MRKRLDHRSELEEVEEVGFYSVLGIAAVGLLILFGIYELIQHALPGVAAIFSGL